MNTQSPQIALDKLSEFTRKTIREITQSNPPYMGTFRQTSDYITVDTKTLKGILMATGGVLKLTCDGTLYRGDIKKRGLGVGVYNVWVTLSVEGKQNG